MAVSEQSQDVFPWLKSLPVAPEFRPTLAEFQDPIAYIFKIEEEASRYGICKILPPLPPPSKKTSISNLNRSLAARAAARVRDGGESSYDYDGGPTFATRQQQIGFCPRKQRPVQRPVWQSGEHYSFGEFEFKAKTFEKNYLKKCGKKSQLSPLEVETLYWRATVDKPFSVEYANDMPGSAFIPLSLAAARRRESGGDGGTVGETAWNMRAMARAEGSLLKFMKEEIPGVTSPMVYIAMMFSWFAWHVEDHDLHSLNYLHMGASKTWYGVPKDAASAFEEVVRVHGYGGELNPLVTFSTLGEKTTVMSPEVFVKAGIPCCRLVQNPGEFVVTFPGAYHSGFSHGFNFGEASNIATPQWLKMAKDAAIRRAAISYPPMVSHLQLLYDYALALGSRVPTSINTKPRSSRLKDKKRSEGERLTKKLFVQNIIHNNELLSSLGKGSPVALLPQSSSDISVCSDLRIGSDLRTNQENRIQLKSEDLSSDSVMVGLNNGFMDTVSVKEKFTSLCEKNRGNETQETMSGAERRKNDGAVGLSDQRLFSCVTCGVLSFDCVAIVQPKEAAARYLMSADCSFFNDWTAAPGSANLESTEKQDVNYFYNVPVQNTDHSMKTCDQRTSTTSLKNAHKDNGALGLLASAYGDSSDSEEEDHKDLDAPTSEGETKKYDQEGRTSDSNSQRLTCGKGKEVKVSHATSSCSTLSCTSEQDRLSKGGNSSLMEIALPFVPRSDDDSCRLHVFCLEHAAEVEQRLCPIGGVHIMLLCHPEYPRIEAEAKIVAEELAINHEWNDTEFRNVTREDEETIQAALDNVEAKGGNSDWTVKLGINLSYSAILSRSPLYSKQMPYNSIIYNAFGRSSPATSSPSKHEVSGRRSSRQRKYVVGKWCGKVWMSHQVHPFLLDQDLEGEESERSCHLRSAMDEDVTGKRLFPCNVSRDATTMFGRKYCRKRKIRAKTVPRKKLTSFKREDGVSDDTSEDHSYKQQWRASGNEEESYFGTGNTMSGDSSNQMSDQELKGIRRNRGVKELESDDEVSDRSLGEEYAVRERADSESSMENSFQLYRERQSMYDHDDDEDDDDDDIYRHPRGIPRSKRTKVFRNPVLFDSEENGVYQQRGRVYTGNREANRLGGEYDSAENSLEEQDFSSKGKRQTRSTAKRKAKPETVQSLRDTKGRTFQEFSSRKTNQELDSYMEGPSTRLRVRKQKPSRESSETKPKKIGKKRSSNASFSRVASEEDVEEDEEAENEEEECAAYQCDMEGCTMSFSSEKQLALHKRNICPVKGCGKNFFSHKYLVQHQRVHSDDRPLKCPWKGCKMTFKWAWSRTEHIRVHTGARPYVCAEPGCGQTFRFVSDFSRHKRKTGHSVKKTKKRAESQDVFPWLKSLPVAPEFRPTLAEFQDPIAYIFKIEEEASRYGICKILPPLPPPSKKTSISNLNRSLAARAAARVRDGGESSCDYDGGPTFATRQQQIGFCPRKQRPVQRPVWQSGEHYSFGEFEAKAKSFEKNYLKRCGKKSQLSPLEIETLYWRATVDKPFSVEYANDMPGSAFIPLSLAAARRREYGGDGGTVGETAWNMRAMARAEGSLLKFMKEEIPGVTSPMVYIAMMFSWFAWHVEDHDLHSLNYLHMGAGKTWYGVPKDAAVAFEEVVRVHGYGGELNPLVTFSTLGDKTTVMSPEVFVKAGVPCCRLVQNPGEFVVTFPRAYHSGFSHGFNCGEASNIATPEWLRMAKDAAIRRAAISYPPMVSHLQLLYDFALALGSRVPTRINAKPRSSRLKDKKRSEGERLTKKLFVQNIIHNNELLYSLGKGSSVALLPQSFSDVSVCSDRRIGSHLRTNQDFKSDRLMVGLNAGFKDTVSVKEKFTSLCERNRNRVASRENETQETLSGDERRKNDGAVGLSDQRLFSCVTCGVLSFDCVAIVQPKEAAARYLMSSDCSFFNDWTVASGSANLGQAARSPAVKLHSQSLEKHHVEPLITSTASVTKAHKEDGALGLLASAYGDSSDSEDEDHKVLDASVSEERNCDQSGASAYEASSFNTDGNEEAQSSDFNSQRLICGKEKDDNTSLLEIALPFVPRSDDDSSRLHVFCLEHAAEVEQQLCPIGGIHLMLLCHPEYPRIEAEAKIVSEELGIIHEWNDTEFRSVTREDEETIQAALDNVEAKGGNSDWTVQLGINLSYSAILSRSPLYSKQMPYNSVIYNVFGRSSQATPSKPEVSGKRLSRQRKYVVGKWCGKVWMSHQVHPFLLQQDLEGEESERSCHLRAAMDEDVTGKRLFPCNVSRDATTMFGRKYCRKRKIRAKAVSRKKLTSFKREDGVSDDTSEDHSYKQQWRASGNEEESYLETGNTVSGDSSNEMSDQELNGIRRNRGIKEFESDDEVSDRSLGEEYAVKERAVSESSLENSFQLYREKQSMYDHEDDDDDDIYRHPKGIPRSKRTKVFRNPVSYDSEDDVYQQSGNGQANRIGGEYDSAEDSLEEQDFCSRGIRQTRSTAKRKVKTEIVESPREKNQELDSYMEGASTRLRVRNLNPSRGSSERKPKKIGKKSSNASFSGVASEEEEECAAYQCDMEGCTMSFSSEKQLALHKRNICPVKGCGKNFFSHKYMVQHQRVHSDDRPLKCPWKGCKMTFKWAWSRTEHIRVHTGARPYACAEPGCGQTFRFVSDFSRHKRKTGHSVKKTKKR